MQMESRCIHCGACLEVCPERLVDSSEHEINDATFKCKLCGKCVEVCPTGARQLVGQKVTVQDVIKQVKRDVLFYDDSHGGVTFSGGEPLQQIDFLLALLRECQKHGIHTAVDTCGYAPAEDVKRMAELADVILYDLKTMDPEKHLEWTGVSNASILENLELLTRFHHNIWIRIPVIPGFNDTLEEMESMATFLASCPGVKQIHLLPYHKLNVQKLKRLGRSTRMQNVEEPDKDKMLLLKKRFLAKGLIVYIGG